MLVAFFYSWIVLAFMEENNAQTKKSREELEREKEKLDGSGTDSKSFDGNLT